MNRHLSSVVSAIPKVGTRAHSAVDALFQGRVDHQDSTLESYQSLQNEAAEITVAYCEAVMRNVAYTLQNGNADIALVLFHVDQDAAEVHVFALDPRGSEVDIPTEHYGQISSMVTRFCAGALNEEEMHQQFEGVRINRSGQIIRPDPERVPQAMRA